ncbi:protein kinase domain-containing protein [Cryptosporangium japonicum]|uniref:protein kinase domain-containing protein n=1 Tax=Cryptosporangium japonicum TaxID=80872 RepID=UPI0031D1D8CC
MVTPLLPSDPQLIGRYSIQGRLGSGGMGIVYLGQSPGGRPAAIKVINERFGINSDSLARFRREVEVLRTVRSAYTAALIDCQLEQPPYWFATEYVPGPTLADAIAQRGPLPPDGGYRLLAALAEGLTDIHQHGICHRDIKPQNVILASTGPQLIDFGIARGTEHVALTQVGAAIGSPGYAAPEVLSRNEVAPPADVFALGATTTYAVTGRKPFGDGTGAVIMMRSMSGEIDLSGVEPRLAELLRACVAVEPGYRPTPEQIIEVCRAQIPAFQPVDAGAVTAVTSAPPASSAPPAPTTAPTYPTPFSSTATAPTAPGSTAPGSTAPGSTAPGSAASGDQAAPTEVVGAVPGPPRPPVSGAPYPGPTPPSFGPPTQPAPPPAFGAPPAFGPPPAFGGPNGAGTPPGSAPRRGRAALVAGVAVLVLVLLLGGGALAFSVLGSDEGEPTNAAVPGPSAAVPTPSAPSAPATGAASPSATVPADPTTPAASASPSTAGAATVTWIDKATSRCLDGNAAGNVYTFPCNDGDYQKWIPEEVEGGFTFTSKATGLCLDSNPSRNVYAMPCNGGDYQVWAVAENGDSFFNLTDKATGFLLDSNEKGEVYAFDANDGDYQRWSRQ